MQLGMICDAGVGVCGDGRGYKIELTTWGKIRGRFVVFEFCKKKNENYCQVYPHVMVLKP